MNKRDETGKNNFFVLYFYCSQLVSALCYRQPKGFCKKVKNKKLQKKILESFFKFI